MRTDGLKVGDRVLVGFPHGWTGRIHTTGTVKRKTPSGITTVTVDAFPRRGTIPHDVVFGPDGWERGERHRSAKSLATFDPRVLEVEAHVALVNDKRIALDDVHWNRLPDAVILQIAEIIEANERNEAKA